MLKTPNFNIWVGIGKSQTPRSQTRHYNLLTSDSKFKSIIFRREAEDDRQNKTLIINFGSASKIGNRHQITSLYYTRAIIRSVLYSHFLFEFSAAWPAFGDLALNTKRSCVMVINLTYEHKNGFGTALSPYSLKY